VVAAYSVRARPIPTVSTPLSWDEVTNSLDSEVFTIDEIPKRIEALGDLMSGTLKVTQARDISAALKKLSSAYGVSRDLDKLTKPRK
jgi:bifunctional non-homologous end joining protein LigD